MKSTKANDVTTITSFTHGVMEFHFKEEEYMRDSGRPTNYLDAVGQHHRSPERVESVVAPK